VDASTIEEENMMRMAKPALATAAIALSLAACQWMGGGGEQAAERQTDTQASSAQASQRYPSATSQQAQSAQQIQSVSPDLLQRVQRRLGDRGYDVGPVDGMWGDATQTALQNFQRDQGIQQSGQIDRQTLAALGIQPQQAQAGQRQQMMQQQEPYRPTTQRGQQQSQIQQSVSPDIVRDIQQNLRDQGYDVGQVDGMWGPGTRQALTSFQRDQNLQPSGRINQETLAALGVGEGRQLGEMPTPTEPESGLGLFAPEPDIGPAERP
jgi:peptidoglycan hydrolase-like protein with peptidoglycan-binding domain